ncbi:hypothetical protein NUACC21_18090 [Scytonema sp. NUACC21]
MSRKQSVDKIVLRLTVKDMTTPKQGSQTKQVKQAPKPQKPRKTESGGSK